ncbi:MAG: Stp1/IreP family PP2C-type Ser/Thr phosphatase [Chloroflexi bacterium]|nr:Stp1/IreP family PP2C-type Ser/Thr phosphatase [Chloroflexota bacterium]
MSETPVTPISETEEPSSSERLRSAAGVDPNAETVMVTKRGGSLLVPDVVLSCGQYTNVGQKRKQNQDSLLTIQAVRVNLSQSIPLGLFVVADGMGGHAAGEVASGLVVSTLARRSQSLFQLFADGVLTDNEIDAWIRTAVEAANRAVMDERAAKGTDMGSTLVLVVIGDTTAHIAHVGDSRAYRESLDGELERLTVDHSLVEQLVLAKQITPAQARTHKRRNIVYRTMGEKENIDIEVRTVDLSPGDRILLCSDGLNSMIEDAHIAAIVHESPSLMDAARRLVDAANQAGGEDNITAVVAEIAPL